MFFQKLYLPPTCSVSRLSISFPLLRPLTLTWRNPLLPSRTDETPFHFSRLPHVHCGKPFLASRTQQTVSSSRDLKPYLVSWLVSKTTLLSRVSTSIPNWKCILWATPLLFLWAIYLGGCIYILKCLRWHKARAGRVLS